MTPEAAAWIRANVLPPALRAPIATCPCEWGPCSNCVHGDHDRCRAGEPAVFPAGWVTNSKGSVVSPAPSSDARVWRVGRPCAWRCACDCRVVPSEAVQLDFFAAWDEELSMS
ncbi:DUF6248 family natural product biosynthesis protein [Actinomadura litoris]|uniref:Uncharacterized protein n=1 Tax=Actinomadura litoris TaxID=2678616 RepID=A0A7K1LAM4_9ACTN|nr:DUF6248 family natural product biosynthesis protein [Actinomadura litoris]MUN41468.1 hypothetical protein [Actinomadura litoris]